MTPQRIIFHHTAINAERAQLEEVDRYHATRDFPKSKLGYYVGYHYLIERSGKVCQTRIETEIGAHDTGENLNSLGVCLAGDFRYMIPTQAQETAFAGLVKDIRSRWDIPLSRLEPHRWDDDTECPGPRVADNWAVRTYLLLEGNVLLRLYWWIGEYLRMV